MAGAKSVRFMYDAAMTLHEVEQLRAIEELAYRRIVDLIVVCENRLLNDDAELARMTKTGEAWPQIKQRLVKDHGVLYVDDAYIRSVRYNETWAAVERSRRQKSQAGKASAAKRAEKNAAQVQLPVPVEPAPVEALPQQPLTDPPDAPATEPVPMNGNGDGGTVPPDWQPNPEGVTFALDRGFTERQIEPLTREFVDRNSAEGIVSKDWNATWRLSVLRAVNSSARPDVGQPMTGALG